MRFLNAHFTVDGTISRWDGEADEKRRCAELWTKNTGQHGRWFPLVEASQALAGATVGALVRVGHLLLDAPCPSYRQIRESRDNRPTEQLDSAFRFVWSPLLPWQAATRVAATSQSCFEMTALASLGPVGPFDGIPMADHAWIPIRCRIRLDLFPDTCSVGQSNLCCRLCRAVAMAFNTRPCQTSDRELRHWHKPPASLGVARLGCRECLRSAGNNHLVDSSVPEQAKENSSSEASTPPWSKDSGQTQNCPPISSLTQWGSLSGVRCQWVTSSQEPLCPPSLPSL
ncbi:hypothetical protein VFPPC_07008 [Pochonia chlamydosporia 170]|uniref:Uncharacterized protein n=1 Tax=Pochonia chlamydosporia 170 TaxID=1380566 RepID=A0A179F9Z9_METCM|nr:hypothetical protein VFPPC_07008 [Pochonia chlamydosporia 170]OAQ62355.2 hypothetical protein VFPPC_07008 [Pochonia chlamydosporia 170]